MDFNSKRPRRPKGSVPPEEKGRQYPPIDPDAPVMTVCGVEFPMRRNGTYPSPVVQKVILLTEERRITQRDFVDRFQGAGQIIGANKLYAWRKIAGEPTAEQLQLISETFDVSFRYLADDKIPPAATAPPPGGPEIVRDRFGHAISGDRTGRHRGELEGDRGGEGPENPGGRGREDFGGGGPRAQGLPGRPGGDPPRLAGVEAQGRQGERQGGLSGGDGGSAG